MKARISSVLLLCALSSSAQPLITAQLTNQTVFGGSNVIFAVAVSGTGPFNFQWQCNGTNLPNSIITTVAGNGNAGYNGDGGLADQSSISGSFGIVVDGAGNVLISDFNNSRVRKVDANGIISTVAGNGTNGFSGDGGAATNASLGNPSGLALDAVGNLYIADFGNNYIRKVDTNGIITTFAGTGAATYAGDGGVAINASLYNPYGLAFDSTGDLYIADSDNNVIRMINPSGIISTVPVYGLVYPTGVGLDPSGNLYIANCNWNTVLRMDTNNVVTTFAGGSSVVSTDGILAVNSGVNYPRDVVVDAVGNVLIAAFYDNRIRVVDTNGIINTVAGNGNAGYSGDNGDAMDATFNYLNAMAIDSHGNLYVSDFFNNRVRAVSYSGPKLKYSNVTTNLSGTYAVVISNSSGSVTSSVATLNVVLPPIISTQPKSQQILVASNVTFNVSAYGTAPMNYQWRINGTNIDGATNSAFTILVVATNDAGNYSVTITNGYGDVTSSNATLSVLVVPPGIATQPASQILPNGSNATFLVVAAGSPPFTYQWLFNKGPVGGQTNASLTLLNVTTNQAGAYSVWVTSPYGSITSHVAILAVGWLPGITMQPTNQSVLAGSQTVLSAGVSGTGPLTFQWQLNGTNLPNNLITTVAGNGTNGFSGDGGSATNAKIFMPRGLAMDNAGNCFIADTSNSRVRKMDANGIITTVAGISVPGFAGDGGAATNARLNTCYGVAVDGLGNLFIADTSNNRIRKVDTNGIITTVVGIPGAGFAGDGGAATNARLYSPYGVAVDGLGNLFIADTSNNRIRKVDTNGIITTVAGGGGILGDGGMATNANLKFPQGVTLDGAGNLLIADINNSRVRKVDVYGVITTVVGNGSSTYSGDNAYATNAGVNPFGLAVDGYGDLLIADDSNNRIRQVDPYGIITTVAGTNTIRYGYGGDGSPATNALLYNPSAVALDSYGRVLLADTYNNRIRRFGQGPTLVLDKLTAASAGNYTLVINSSFGSVTSAVATLTVLLPPAIVNQPLSQSAGLGSNVIFSVTTSGTTPFSYLWLIKGVMQAGQTNQTLNLTKVDWPDAGNYQVIVTNNYGSITSAVATLTVGVPPAIVNQPTNQVILAGGNGQLSVAVSGGGPFSYQWQLNGTNLPPIITTVAGTNSFGYSGDGGAATNARLNNPYGVAVDAAGDIFIADNANYRVRMVDTNGIIHTYAGTGGYGYTGNGGRATNATLGQVQAVTLDAAGNLFVADYGEVRKVGTNGVITCVAGTGGSGFSFDGGVASNTVLGGATGVAVDGQGNAFLDDYYTFRVRKVGTNGILTTVAGITAVGVVSGFSGDGGRATNANLSTPFGVALDSAGDIFVSDTGNYRIREVDTNGIINTIIGGGAGSTDGLQGTNTDLFSPQAVAVDPGNNVYVTSSGRIRKMDMNGVMTTVAGGGSHNPGDYGPATGAVLISPKGIALDTLGNLYIADAGGSRIRKVHNSGDPTLQLLNSSLANSGNYTVVITSPFGSVASSAASFTVVVTPTIQISGPTNGQFNFSWNTTSNVNYQVQYATNLVSPNWINLGGPVTATNNSLSIMDPGGSDGQRFYRVRLLP